MESSKAETPNELNGDCSLAFCSLICPQWCTFHLPPPSTPSHPIFYLSPLLTIIIVLISFATFALICYLIILKYCKRRASNVSFSNHPSPVRHGVMLDKLTIIHHHREGPSTYADGDCSVCLVEFNEGDSLRILPKCEHAFHARCIEAWLSAQANCPLCRTGVDEHRVAGIAAAGDVSGEEMAGGFELEGERVIEIGGEEGLDWMPASESSYLSNSQIGFNS